jgi:hypothetical protein
MPPSATGNGQSRLAVRIVALHDVQSFPHPDTGQVCPPPYQKLRPVGCCGGARMRRRDRLALRAIQLLDNPPPCTDGKEVRHAN